MGLEEQRFRTDRPEITAALLTVVEAVAFFGFHIRHTVITKARHYADTPVCPA